MLKIAVLVSGGGTNLQAIIDSIADGRITDTEIKVVISNNPKAKALERAAKAGIEAVCISPKQYADREINIHPSLIPSFCGTGYYGLHVHEAALKRGVKISGATVHFVDEGTDTGPIIMQKPVEVRPDDTPEVLQRRIMEQAEWQIMPKVIDLIAHDKVHVKDGRVFVEE